MCYLPRYCEYPFFTHHMQFVFSIVELVGLGSAGLGQRERLVPNTLRSNTSASCTAHLSALCPETWSLIFGSPPSSDVVPQPHEELSSPSAVCPHLTDDTDLDSRTLAPCAFLNTHGFAQQCAPREAQNVHCAVVGLGLAARLPFPQLPAVHLEQASFSSSAPPVRSCTYSSFSAPLLSPTTWNSARALWRLLGCSICCIWYL